VKKVQVDKLSHSEMEYAFAKHMGILLGDDTIVLRNDFGNLSVYHISRFHVCRDTDLLNMVLKEKFQKIDVIRKNQNYVATYNGINVEDSDKNVAIIKAFLKFKAKSNNGQIEIPERIN
jgi:hypothetical protein